MTLRTALVSFLSVSLLACNAPTPSLAKLVAPALTAQRRAGGDLQVILTYDTTKTDCGTVPNLVATFDGANVAASAGSFDPKAMTETERCQFPGFLLTPTSKADSREIVFSDGATTMSMSLSTVDVGSAIADSPPATIRSGTSLRWLTSMPAAGTKSFKVTFTPAGGAEATWLEGTTLGATQSATVPPQTASASGDVGLTWLVNSTVLKCEGLASCEAVIQGTATYKAVVSP